MWNYCVERADYKLNSIVKPTFQTVFPLINFNIIAFKHKIPIKK